MSLDSRLRRELTEFASESPPKPLDVASDLQVVRVAGRRSEVLHRTYRGIAIVALALIAAFVVPSLLREFGSQEVNTADDPAIESDVNDGDTSGPSKPGEVSRPSLGGVGAGGSRTNEAGESQVGQGAATTRQGSSTGQAGSSGVPTPKQAGTYSYSVSGQACGGLATCSAMKEFKATFDEPTGSHQHAREKWTNNDGSRYEAEYSYDYRPDGVYYEHYTGVLYTKEGAVLYAWACPELRGMPVRVWPAGTKPGDRFEYTTQCEGSSSRTIVDVLRAETISVGGRDVETFYVQSRANRRTTESWVYPSHFLSVKGHERWTEDYGGGESWTMLDSMTPS
jgi:hypothetical protein